LELLAVLIGTRAVKFVRNELRLPISGIRAFTDSECVLHWIKSTKQLPTWNASDISPAKLKEFLNEPKKVGSQVLYESSNVVSSEGQNYLTFSPLGIDETKFSSLWRLLRVTVICLKFIKKCVLNKCSQEKILQECVMLKKVFKDMIEESVYYTEIQDVLLLWISTVQHKRFSDVFIAIQKGETNCLQKQLGLEIDDMGISRCSGRLQNANLSEPAKYPKLLPRCEHFTHLLIQYVHERLIHCGVSHTLASLRQEYWILKGRMEVKTVISRCLVCQQQEGPSFSLLRMPPWPKERVTQSLPFQYIGFDYLGPLLVNEGGQVAKV